MSRDASPSRSVDALLYLGYDDSARCQILFIPFKGHLAKESHEVFSAWACTRTVSRDTEMPNKALQKEARRLWDHIIADNGAWSKMELNNFAEIVRPCRHYKIFLFD
jgi:hypothetical protein